METILDDFSEQALTTAIESNLFEIFLLFRHWRQAEVHDDGDMLWSLTNVPSPLFNSVLRAHLLPQNVDQRIEAAVRRCAARHVPMMWWTGPGTRPVDLGVHLLAHGFMHAEDASGMAADLQDLKPGLPTPDALAVELVQNRETLETWSRVVVRGFGLPDFVASVFVDLFTSLGFDGRLPIRNYLGRLAGTPVATATLFFGAGVAGIYDVATLPEVRRHGIGTALTVTALREAQRQGYRVSILHATEMGVGVYRQLGFKEYFKIGQYLWAPANEGASEQSAAPDA